MMSPFAYKLSRKTSLALCNTGSPDKLPLKERLTKNKPNTKALRVIKRQYLLHHSVASNVWKSDRSLMYLLKKTKKGIKVQGLLILPRPKNMRTGRRAKSIRFFLMFFRKMYFEKGHNRSLDRFQHFVQGNEIPNFLQRFVPILE